MFKRIWMLVIILTIGLFILYEAITEQVTPPKLIAHAGGGFEGNTYTNSQESLDFNYEIDHRFFEVDISLTSDNKLILLHDWQGVYQKYFGNVSSGITAKEFKSLKMASGMHQMTIEDLYDWLENNADAFIITDVKSENLEMLKFISDTYDEYDKRIIPQIYQTSEFEPVKAMGYENIIFTLYRTGISDEEVLEFGRNNDLFAVTMPAERARSLAQDLSDNGIIVYAHTINSVQTFDELQEIGVHGVYTDFMDPSII